MEQVLSIVTHWEVKRTSQVYRFLIEEFGGASSTLETWVLFNRLNLSVVTRPAEHEGPDRVVSDPAGQVLQRPRILLLRLLHLEDLHLHYQHCVRPGGEGGPHHEDVRHPGELVRTGGGRHALVPADFIHRRRDHCLHLNQRKSFLKINFHK